MVAVIINLIILLLLYGSVPLAISFLSLKGGHGIFNVRSDLSACCAQEGEADTDKSAQVWKQMNRKMILHPVTPSNRTEACGFTVQPIGQLATNCHQICNSISCHCLFCFNPRQ